MEQPVINKYSCLRDVGLTVRTRNLLFQNCRVFGIEPRFGETGWTMPISVLEGYPLEKLKLIRGFGPKSRAEVKQLLQRAGIEEPEVNEKPAGSTTVHFNRFTRKGKILYELARLFEKDEEDFFIQE